MKLIGKWWLPDDEELMIDEITRNGYWHPHRLAAALRGIPLVGKDPNNLRTVVDAGAHVGMWTAQFAARAHTVLAFEPVPSTFECLQANVATLPAHLQARVRTFNVGLADRPTVGTFVTDTRYQGNSGGSWMLLGAVPDGDRIPMTRLDDFLLNDLDFIKIDVEGMEPLVIRGAYATLSRCKPVICWENKPVFRDRYGWEVGEPERLLTAIGARLLLPETKGKDEVWGWTE